MAHQRAPAIKTDADVGIDGQGEPAGRRVAQLVAEALEMPAAVVHYEDEASVVVAPGPFDARALQDAWSALRPDGHTTPVELNGDGRTLCAHTYSVTLSGRPAVVAGVCAADTPLTPNVVALRTLIGALDLSHREQRASIARWLQRLENDNRHMARAQRLIGVGTLTFDFRSGALELSPTAGSVLGEPGMRHLDDLIDAFDPFDRPHIARLLTGANGSAAFDVERALKGAERWVRLRGELIKVDGEPSYLFATVQDVTTGRAQMARAKELAERCSLTGVYNRTVFDRAMRRAMERAEEERLYAGLMLIDIDDFKDVNDTYGHPAGDEVLRFVASTLTSLTRGSDTVLRLAGDEFAVIVGQSPEMAGILTLAERIRDALSTSIGIGEDTVRVSASVGLAIFPEDISPRVDIYKACDQALFAAKAGGRGALCRFVPRMAEAREGHRAFLAAVREGLERGEFVPYFQPKLELETGVLVGFEALCRWQTREEGTLGPGAFSSAFEDRELAGPLSDVSLYGAFEAVAAFKRGAIPFGHIAVNLNRAQLERANLTALIADLAAQYGVKPNEIVFEVLENVLIKESPTVYDNLSGLFDAGYSVALDDFGTGFASLAHVREPFIQQLKIDRSFVTGFTQSSDDHQIVAAIVQMAHKMGLTLVAEGIEDEATRRSLLALGCEIGQGFMFSKAIAFDEAAEFARRAAPQARPRCDEAGPVGRAAAANVRLN